MPVRHVLRFLVFVPLFVLGAVAARGQTLIVYNVDASAFPTISANVVAFDANGDRVTSIAPEDLSILEDGIPVTDITVTCPTPTPALPFNAVLVNDRSGSMTTQVGGRMTRMDLAKLGSSEFVLATRFDAGAAIAVTAFESEASIVSDFQTSAVPLLNAIATMRASGGTLYNPPFLDPLAGAIGMLAARPAGPRRVIVFLTDGQPNEGTLVTSIIAAASNASIEVYAVTIGMPMNTDLQTISAATGGTSFGNVNNVEQMRAIYQQIALSAGGIGPCVVTWRTRPGCGRASIDRSVSLEHIPTGGRTRVTYVAPLSSVTGIDAVPAFINFGLMGPGDSLDRQVTITAANDSLRVLRAEIVPEGAFRIIDWGGPPPPFAEDRGSQRTITVRFKPTDSLKYVASLVLHTGPCPPFPITLTGGAGRDDGTSLKLLAPLGGESFAGCDSVLIRWGGVTESTPIDIDASSDDGVTWTRVARDITGLRHVWMPPRPGTGWRIRITAQTGEEQFVISTRAGGGDLLVDDIPASDARLLSPTGVESRGDSMFIAESGAHRIRRVDRLTGRISTIAGTGNPGLNGEVIARLARLNNPMHVMLIGDYLFFADYGNHMVRRINLQTGNIFTVAGTGASGFSGDGGPASGAQLSFPSYLAYDGTNLYVSDAGNQRIRRIQLGGTEPVSTVAGGGSLTTDDIPAANAVIPGVAGIAADGEYLYFAESSTRRIRRIDLGTRLITTIAGTGASGSSGDGGFARVATFMSPVGVELDAGMLYVTDTAAHRVRRIDLSTGIITTIAGTGAPGFSGDGGDATLARLNAPGQPAADEGFLYVPDIHNSRVRAISIGRGPGSDSSRSSFSVSVPALAIRSLTNRQVSVGAMAIGRPRDTTVVGAVCNVGDLPLTVDSAWIVGANAADFSIVSGAPSGEIALGACDALEIRFRPTALGPRTAMAILRGRCANVDTVWLSGVGVDTCAVDVLGLADVGEIVLGTGSRDTVVERSICNRESTPIGINVRLVDGDRTFTIIEGSGPFTLAPGACHVVKVRFAPTISGRASGAIDYGLPAVCGTARTRLFGRALGSPELFAPDLVALGAMLCDPDRDTTIAIANTGGAPLVISRLELVINDEGFSITSMIPSEAIPIVIPPGGVDSIAIRFAPAVAGAKTAAIEIASNASGSPHRIALSATYESVMLVAEPLLAFPAKITAVPYDTTIVVRNGGTVAVEIASASIGGNDAAAFIVEPAQLPMSIAAGSSASIDVQLVAAPGEATLRARLDLVYGPTCDSGIVAIDIVAAGGAPELAWSSVEMTQICAGDTARATVRLSSVGGDDVVITSVSIENDPAGAFAWSYPLPVTIPAGDEIALPVAFSTDAIGGHTAELVLATNTTGGSVRVELRGRRELVAIAATPAELSMSSTGVGIPIDGTITLTNNGTAPVTISTAMGDGAFVVVSTSPTTLAPGASATIRVRATALAGGRHRDTLVVTEAACGSAIEIPLDIEVVAPAVARITLPTMQAAPNERVAMPMSIAMLDAETFAASGARGYVATVTMYGTVVIPDSVGGASIVSNTYDRSTRVQTLTISGEYDGGDVLATIYGRTILGDTLGTPLVITSFAWDRTTVGAELVDGALTIVGSCFELGLRLVATPIILRVSPMPASNAMRLDLDLDAWQNVRVVVYDVRGLPVRVLAEQTLTVGEHALMLDVADVPTGMYTLAVETAYGRVVTPVVVKR